MPLDQLANIAEISAAALLIVSLIYVGIQIKQNTKATKISTSQAFDHKYISGLGVLLLSMARQRARLWTGWESQFCDLFGYPGIREMWNVRYV